LKTDKKLVIVGDGAFTDKYVSELKALAQDDKRIIFTGNQTGAALDELFANAFLFVQPSESEGLSIALLEAMSYGRGTLVSNIPENIEAVSAEGITFNNKSASDLQEKMKALLVNTDLVAANGRKNFERVRIHYNWNEISAEVEKIYQLVIDSNIEKKRFARLRLAGKAFGLFF
jgi:glycosyltransferase involved in cell wall biosynthesis